MDKKQVAQGDNWMRAKTETGWNRQFVLVACWLLLGAGGCASTMEPSRVLMPTPVALTLGMSHPGDEGLETSIETEVPVFVVSGRNVEPDSEGLSPFGNNRSHQPTLAVAKVKIGEGLTSEELYHETVRACDKKKALVEFAGVELSPDPIDLDPWLLKDDVARLQDNSWVKAVNAQLDRDDRRDVCIFVHGYNTHFIENTLLAAEIYHYTGRHGAMISFEWPSESNILGYMADKGNATYSTRHFRGLIASLSKECDIDSITIIAHSAGTPIVVNALRELRLLEHGLTADEVREKYRVGRVVLAAPDMDLMAFVNAIHDRFFEMAQGVAVYASPNDNALRLSQALYNEKRLGRSVGRLAAWEEKVLLAADNLEMIDASRADKQYENLLGHSYFHRDPWVSSDIGSFILSRSPESRELVREPDEVFWKFPQDYPDRLARKMNKEVPDRFSLLKLFSKKQILQ